MAWKLRVKPMKKGGYRVSYGSRTGGHFKSRSSAYRYFKKAKGWVS